ncbi:MAG: agmatinase [bacterium]
MEPLSPDFDDDVIERIDTAPFRGANFCGLPPEFSSFENSRFVVVPVPFEETTSFRRGAAGAPAEIISASAQVELLDVEAGAQPFRAGIHTCADFMNLPLTLDDVRGPLTGKLAEIFSLGKTPVVIGGEHTVSIAPVAAACAAFEDLTLVHLDAHADLRNEYEGNRFSHACALRRAMELSPPPSRLIMVGVRSMCPEEIRFVRDSAGVTLRLARDVRSGAARLDRIAADAGGGSVYITIDMDVFDPSEVPAVGTPEPGGLGWGQVCGLLAGIVAGADVVGFDVVELAPAPHAVRSQFLAAKLIYRLMGLIWKKRRNDRLEACPTERSGDYLPI